MWFIDREGEREGGKEGGTLWYLVMKKNNVIDDEVKSCLLAVLSL